jgi:hypothetical protein
MPIKIAGQEIDQTLPEDFIILRPDTGKEVLIKARAFRDFDEFNAVCPLPEPPGRQERGKGWVTNPNDPTFKQRMEQHSLQRVGWMILQSLYEIEWETVDSENPKTWPKWEEELKDSGFTQIECNLLIALILDVNGLNEEKMKLARESFLRGQEEDQRSSNSQTSEQANMPSGVPANDGE